MSLGWQIFVFVIVVGSFIAHFVFLTWTSRYRAKEVPGDDSGGPGTTGHTWDGDLEELNNPLPRWWLFLFHGTVVFGIIYLLLYPGLGVFDGFLGWSQEQRYAEAVAEAEARYGEVFERFAAQDLVTLSADQGALAAGVNLYGNHCAQCHGADGRGAVGFPNLTDDAWQWGGAPEQVQASILNGRMGIMPPWGSVLGGDEAVDRVAHYVLSLSGREHDADQAAAGAQQYGMFCAACHGPDGAGNQALGAPDLTDQAWLYEPTLDSIRHTINNGRNNQMPAFADSLGEDRVKLLAAYVLSLSGGQQAGAPAGENTGADD